MKRITLTALIVLCGIGFTAENTRAQQYAESLGEIFLSFSETERVPTQDVPVFAPFQFYLIVEMTYADIGRPGDDADLGFYAWEAAISIPLEITVVQRELNPPGAINVGVGLDNWIVGMTVDVTAAMTPFTVVRYTGLLLTQGLEDLALSIGPSDPSSFTNPGAPPGPPPGWAEFRPTGECDNVCLRGFETWQTRMVVNCVNAPECIACDKGDIVLDGEINSADAIRGLFFAMDLLAPSPDEFCAADMNSDGAIEVGDIVLVLQAAVGTLPTATANAAPPIVSARLGEDPGDVVLHVENAAGVDVLMTYDPSDVTFVSASRPGSQGVVVTNDRTPGQLRLGFAKAARFDGDILLKFDVRNSHSALRFGPVSAYDELGGSQFVELSSQELFFGATSADTRRAWGASRLLSAVPNPFNPTTQLRFVLSAGGDVRLEIFDAAGRRLRQFHLTGLAAGEHGVTWDGRDDRGARVASGAYVVRFESSGGETDTDRILMLK